MSLINTQTTNEPDTFTFGASVVIGEAQLATCLNEFFQLWTAGNDRLVIVGHGMESTIGLLKDYWKPPASAILLDTQKIWQIQNAQQTSVTLEKALGEKGPAPGLDSRYNHYLLNNAGNDARFILDLLKVQAWMAELFVRHAHRI
ncbi:hypothetical protein F5Y04DRAFT_285657 [Hypomontagnella monticulosa]|nr:hypothetical protein F5Y04DRAFT_285657 [Hypomontagnella monticulosa]